LFHPLGEVSEASFMIRTFAEPAGVMAAVRRAAADVDSALPLKDMGTLDTVLDDVVARERMIARLSAFFGALALLLASIGLYGVLSYAIARRTNEIGIRMALGAAPGRVVGTVLRETVLLVAIGAALGIPLAIAGSRVISSKLFGLGVADPLTLASATAVLAAVAMVAGYLPARRAAQVDPVVALRCE
jgi:ABC-type antimicrobial peptide transport system permease subunit